MDLKRKRSSEKLEERKLLDGGGQVNSTPSMENDHNDEDEDEVTYYEEGQNIHTNDGWHAGLHPSLHFAKLEDIPKEVKEKLLNSKLNYAYTYNPKVGITFCKSMMSDFPSASSLSSQSNANNTEIGSVIIENHFVSQNDVSHNAEESYFKYRVEMAWKHFLEWIKWEEKSVADRIFFILFEGPLVLVRNLTIPKADPEDWSRFFAVLSPLFMPSFALFATGYLSLTVGNSQFPLWVLLTLIGLLCSILIYFTTNGKRRPVYHVVFVVVSFVMSILWIYLIANELVDVLNSMGVLWNISDSILSIVLSAGNSLSDLAADVAVARQGFVEMAVAASYSAPGLSLLCK